MKRLIPVLLICVLFLLASFALPAIALQPAPVEKGDKVSITNSPRKKVVALDGFHNNETKQPLHYHWEGTYPGGFSEFGKLLQNLGAEIRTVREKVSRKTLKDTDVFIIVDPDTPDESTNPQYIEDDELAALERWVRAGGRLVLLGNDKGNAEFAHFNRLAARFGLEFIETTYKDAQGESHLTLTSTNQLLGAGLMVYLVDVAPLKITNNRAQILLADQGTPIMALVPAGRGFVFALGDPWLYNEYIGRKDNRQVAAHLFRYLLEPA